MSVPNCLICCTRFSNANSLKITSRLSNAEIPNDFIIAKLRYIAPEVEWCEEHSICEQCLKDLLMACKFKERCLKRKNFCSSHSSSVITKEEGCMEQSIESEGGELNQDTLNCIERPLECNSKKICSKCGRGYGSRSLLEAHATICSGIRRQRNLKWEHQCGKCKKYYMSQKILRAHAQKCDMTAMKKTDFQCKNCCRYYKTSQLLKRHISTRCRQTTNDGPDREFEESSDCKPIKKYNRFSNFTCERCDEKFNVLRKVVEHCIQAHSMDRKSIKPYLCETCNARFKTSTNLLSHQLYHNGSRTNICSYCGKSFITKSDLLAHELTHFNTRPFKCNSCDKAFKTNTNLHAHKLNVHTDPSEWKHVCLVCGKRFSQKTNHDQHMRRHLGEKNFVCHICSKGFATKKEMKEHEGHHSNLRAFQCEYCGNAYRKRYNYRLHLTRVHGIGNTKLNVLEKKYACHICPAKFSEKRKLSRHLWKHSGLKPYSCAVCDKKFSDSSYLKCHVRIKHNVEDKNTAENM